MCPICCAWATGYRIVVCLSPEYLLNSWSRCGTPPRHVEQDLLLVVTGEEAEATEQDCCAHERPPSQSLKRTTLGIPLAGCSEICACSSGTKPGTSCGRIRCMSVAMMRRISTMARDLPRHTRGPIEKGT